MVRYPRETYFKSLEAKFTNVLNIGRFKKIKVWQTIPNLNFSTRVQLLEYARLRVGAAQYFVLLVLALNANAACV